MDATLHQQTNLEHAQWRVRFVRSLLDTHQHCVDTHSKGWWLKEAELLQRLAAAEDDLTMQMRRCAR